MQPENLKYTKEHEWILVEGDSATVGITDYAQEALGDVVYVELPKIGAELAASQEFGVVESVKTVSSLYCPVSGIVTAENAELAANPAMVNTDPYGKGWMIKLKIKNPEELKQLLSLKAYQALLE